ncbi:MAG: hypothetical protein ACHQ53_16030, partial [Polyangiales bacterium]
MSDAKLLVLGPLVLLSAGYTVFFWRALRQQDGGEPAPRFPRPSRLELMLGALTDFLDTLGIGSFA